MKLRTVLLAVFAAGLSSIPLHATPVSLTCRMPDANGIVSDTAASFQLIFDEAAGTAVEGTMNSVSAQFTDSAVTWSQPGGLTREFNRMTGVLTTHDGPRCYNARDGQHCYWASAVYKCSVAARVF